MFQIDNIREMFFSWEGRLNRKAYILRCLTLGLIMTAIYILLMVITFTTAAAQMGNDLPMMGAFGATYILYLPFIISGYLLAIRRLHDLNMSGFFCLLNFVPLVNIGLGLYLFFKKGTEGDNDYGSDPLDMTGYVYGETAPAVPEHNDNPYARTDTAPKE